MQLALSLKTISALAVTWDFTGSAQACTVVTGSTGNGSGTVARCEQWGLVNPVSGAKTLKAAWTGSSDVCLNGVSWTGVDQTGGATSFPHGTSATGTSATPSVTVTSATGNATMSVSCADAGIYATPNQTQTFLDNSPASIGGGGERAAGAATVTHTWATGDSSSHWVNVGCDILAFVAAVGDTQEWLGRAVAQRPQFGGHIGY